MLHKGGKLIYECDSGTTTLKLITMDAFCKGVIGLFCPECTKQHAQSCEAWRLSSDFGVYSEIYA